VQDEFNINEISLNGFQVVRGLYFSRQLEPSFTIWYSSVAFNMAAFSALHNCESISILINSDTRCVIIKPITSKDRDAINWLKPPDYQKHQKLECARFTHQLFDLWQWDKELHYRTNGRLVTSDKKLMLIFDFSRPEVWRGLKMVNDFE
jgi:hypothetical protein